MKKLFHIVLIVTTLHCFGQEKDNFKVRGFIDTYHAFGIKEPMDFLTSRTRFRGEIQKIKGKSYFFTSFNATHNNILPDLTKIELREAYLEYTDNNWGFKAGRQIIIWGKADGLKITDIISPMDLTEFLAQDYDDIRMPVNAFAINIFNNNWDFEFVCVPVFESYKLPGKDNPWGIDFSLINENIEMDAPETPELSLRNIEYGGKLSFYLSGIDFDFSALHTWNKSPVYSYYNDSIMNLHLKPEHHRLGFLGIGFSKSLGEFILRGESAFYIEKKFSPVIEQLQTGLIEKNSIIYLAGIDWYPGNEWTITGQFSDEYIFNYSNSIENSEHTYISTLGISKNICRSTLKLSTFAYVGINEGDFFDRTSIDYAISDNIHVSAGLDWFYGENGVFGQYKDNSELWLKAKFNF